jgi:hypothetical protein
MPEQPICYCHKRIEPVIPMSKHAILQKALYPQQKTKIRFYYNLRNLILFSILSYGRVLSFLAGRARF